MRKRGRDEWFAIGFKAYGKKPKKKKKKKTKEKQRKRKEKKKKERMLGLDSNEERWESEKCEWCNRALSNRGKNEFWKIDIAYSNSKSKIIKWYKT